jgi:hypothetical protein
MPRACVRRITSLTPGERVARRRRFDQPGRARSADRRICGPRLLPEGEAVVAGQSRVRGSAAILTRSMVKAQHRRCSSGRMPAYSLKLDHRQSWG